MERNRLITLAQFRELSRPTSAHLDEESVNALITECEDTFIIPAIGWGSFKAATDSGEWANVSDGFNANILTDGGEWEQISCDGVHISRYCPGLRKALAYFVYAKLLRSDGTILSRAGAMRHNEDYGNHIDTLQKQYNDIMDIAESYLSDTLMYLKAMSSGKINKVRGSRAKVHAIGD